MKPDDLIDEKKIIRSKCRDAEAFAPMYRGTDNKPTVPFIATIRTDRKPRDSGPFLAELFDRYMEFLKYPHRKANTLSVSVDEEQAVSYGSQLFRIYPFDGCQYVYSKAHDDLIRVPKSILGVYRSSNFGRRLAEKLNVTQEEMTGLGIQFRDGDFTFEDMQLDEFFRKHSGQILQVTGIRRAYSLMQVDAYGEILVYGKEYLAVPQSRGI